MGRRRKETGRGTTTSDEQPVMFTYIRHVTNRSETLEDLEDVVKRLEEAIVKPMNSMAKHYGGEVASYNTFQGPTQEYENRVWDWKLTVQGQESGHITFMITTRRSAEGSYVYPIISRSYYILTPRFDSYEDWEMHSMDMAVPKLVGSQKDSIEIREKIRAVSSRMLSSSCGIGILEASDNPTTPYVCELLYTAMMNSVKKLHADNIEEQRIKIETQRRTSMSEVLGMEMMRE